MQPIRSSLGVCRISANPQQPSNPWQTNTPGPPILMPIEELWANNYRYRIQNAQTFTFAIDTANQFMHRYPKNGYRYDFPAHKFIPWRNQIARKPNLVATPIPEGGVRIILMWTLWQKEFHCFLFEERDQQFAGNEYIQVYGVKIRAPRGVERSGSDGYYAGTVLEGFYYAHTKTVHITDVFQLCGKFIESPETSAKNEMLARIASEINEENKQRPGWPLHKCIAAKYKPLDLHLNESLLIVHKNQRFVRPI